MWWDRRKDREGTRSTRGRIISALLNELDTIAQSLAVPDLETAEAGGGAVAVDMNIPFLPDAAFRAAVSSGALALLPPELQGTLSTFYEHLRITRLYVDQLITAYAGGGDVEAQLARIRSAASYLAGHSAALLDQVADIRTALLTAAQRSAVA
jgi:hypothetical protein